MQSGEDTPIHFPQAMHYACEHDGDCGRDYWEIRVEPSDEDRILALDWRACSRCDASEDSPFRRSDSDATDYTAVLSH